MKFRAVGFEFIANRQTGGGLYFMCIDGTCERVYVYLCTGCLWIAAGRKATRLLSMDFIIYNFRYEICHHYPHEPRWFRSKYNLFKKSGHVARNS